MPQPSRDPTKNLRVSVAERSPRGFHASERALVPTPLNLTENRPTPKHDNPLLTVFRFMFLSNIRLNLRRCRDMLCGMWCALISVFSAISTAHITRDAPSLQFGDGFEGDDTAVLVTIMGTLVNPVGEACPAPPRLQMEPFDERVFHGFCGMTGDGACIVRDEFVLAIVTGMGVPEVADVRFSTQLFCQWVVRFQYQVLGLSDERAYPITVH